MWWYHWSCWLLSASGVVCILIAHEHYSIDVLIGYIATTRLFWWYHTMANTHVGAHARRHAGARAGRLRSLSQHRFALCADVAAGPQ